MTTTANKIKTGTYSENNIDAMIEKEVAAGNDAPADDKEYECRECGANHMNETPAEIYRDEAGITRCVGCGGICDEMTGDIDEDNEPEMTEKSLRGILQNLIEDEMDARTETLQAAGYMTRDTGLEVKIGSKTFIITIQER